MNRGKPKTSLAGKSTRQAPFRRGAAAWPLAVSRRHRYGLVGVARQATFSPAVTAGLAWAWAAAAIWIVRGFIASGT